MGVAKLKYLNVYGPERNLLQALYEVAKNGCFAPESSEAIHSGLSLSVNEYEPLLTKAKGLLKDLGHSSLAADYNSDMGVFEFEQVSQFLEKIAADFSNRSKRHAEILAQIELQEKTEEILSHMKDLDLNVEALFSIKTMKVRIGRLPKNSYVRLQYYADKGFNFTSYFNFLVYDFDGEYYWGIYFAPTDSAHDIDNIFSSLYFERSYVPDFVQGTPEQALEISRNKEKELKAELQKITTPAGIASEQELIDIQNMAAWLSIMNQVFEMKKYAMVFNKMFYISGFVAQDDYRDFENHIETVNAVHIKEATQKQKVPAKPPIKLKNSWFARPYEMFTEMYGLPSNKDIDPTGIVAVIYSVLFGVMFADLGQGLVLGLVGYFFMYKKKSMPIGLILARASIFSCIFGFLFGSVFGYEHMLDPLWHKLGFAEKPFEVLGAKSINIILLGSVGIGVLIMMFTIVLSIITKLRKRNYAEGLFGASGVAGLVFYIAAIGILLDKIVFKSGLSSQGFYMPIFIVLPLVLIYLQQPLGDLVSGKGFKIENPSDFFVSGFFELFVSVLEYLSNTVSFLRVGGFVLAHAGMMSVVATLAQMAGPAGSVVVMVIGNIFVMCLEGLIIGIQTLRLNFYEVFSRFYDAGGKEFKPLKLVSDDVKL